jgi:hypothetical protein
MNQKVIILVGLIAIAFGQTDLRVANAIIANNFNVDVKFLLFPYNQVFVDNILFFNNVPFGQVTPYVTFPPGSRNVAVYSQGALIVNSTINFGPKAYSTFALYNSPPKVIGNALADACISPSRPTNSLVRYFLVVLKPLTIHIRVVNLSPSLTVDFVLAEIGVTFPKVFPNGGASNYVEGILNFPLTIFLVPAGIYTVKVTPPGNPNPYYQVPIQVRAGLPFTLFLEGGNQFSLIPAVDYHYRCN